LNSDSKQAESKEKLQLVILGASNAVPGDNQQNTHFVVVGGQRMVLVDCTGNPIIRLKQAGLDYRDLTDLILTHFHPDHVAGVPPFLMNLWLLGRTDTLHIYGLGDTLDRVEKMMELYQWHTWPGFFPVVFNRLPEVEMAVVLDTEDFSIFSSPVHHIIPTIGLRFDSHASGNSIAYSCDTEPCPEVITLAKNCEVLIHEATGETFGHTSAAQAGGVAQRSEARRLILIHYVTFEDEAEGLVAQAASSFGGPVSLAKNFMRLEF
jgi:ribonuclease Z